MSQQFTFNASAAAFTPQQSQEFQQKTTETSVDTENYYESWTILESLRQLCPNFEDDKLLLILENTQSNWDKIDYVLFNETPNKQNMICRYFLEGACYRNDCRYSHEVNQTICSFWLQGSCYKNNDCPFLHTINLDHYVKPAAQTEGGADQATDKLFPSLSNSTERNVVLDAPKLEVGFHYGSSALVDPSQSYTNVLKIGRLQKMFPSCPEKVIKIHLKQNSYNEPDTTSDLENQGYSHKPIVLPTPKKPNYPVTNSISLQKAGNKEDIDWVQTGDQASLQYNLYRQEAIAAAHMRNQLFQRAADAWRLGDRASARAFSTEGRKKNAEMERLHLKASDEIFRQRNAKLFQATFDYSTKSIQIDLHALHPTEAILQLERLLEDLKAHQWHGSLKLLVGTEHHSQMQGKTRLKEIVLNWCHEHRWSATEERGAQGSIKGGVISVCI